MWARNSDSAIENVQPIHAISSVRPVLDTESLFFFFYL